MQDAQKRSPLEIFSGAKVSLNRKHWKPFGCPVYVLESALQGQKPWHKWRQRSNIGIYLGQSPIHNRSTALVLHCYTGHVSPQFHVSFDKSFHSCTQETLETKWRVSAYFERASRSSRKRSHSTTNDSKGVTFKAKTGSSRTEGAIEAPASHASDPSESTEEGQQSNNSSEQASGEQTNHEQGQVPPEPPPMIQIFV